LPSDLKVSLQFSRTKVPDESQPAFAVRQQPLSLSLQQGICFVHPPIPALPQVFLAVDCLWWQIKEQYGLTRFCP